MNVKLIQIDGDMPNLALMRIASYHRDLGDTVWLTRDVYPDLFDPPIDVVYASAIFKWSSDKIATVRKNYKNVIIGGTGVDNTITLPKEIESHNAVSYDDYPDITYSLGFSQRGCRLRCKFCEVPQKEGKQKSASTIANIWRGGRHPKHIHLLDNDFFGNPNFEELASEIIDGGYKICLSQGINARLVTEDGAKLLAQMKYTGRDFKTKHIYTAWDNIRDEKIFFRGIDILDSNGVSQNAMTAYMLVGYDKNETWDDLWYRFIRLKERGIRPYPMVYDRNRTDLISFQRYAVANIYHKTSWLDFVRSGKPKESNDAYIRARDKFGVLA